MKFSLLFIVLINISFARESFEFNLGQKINVLSDKAFRKTRENEFEAVGNVVITHMKNSIYGEKAKLNFNTGETIVEGNVRYISPTLTLYGTKLQYNFISHEINLTNARILSESYSVVGKSFIQTAPDELFATDAEYSTCKDCPESWSIYGKNIKVTVGQYVTIKNAFLKVNGVIAMYIPYIVFPIKQKRESGIIFPAFSYKADEGIRYQQPYFYVIDDYSDATITPSVFGKRGYGGEFQFRKNFAEKTWLNINAMGLNDRVYEPYKISKELSGEKTFREFSDLEFHGIYKENLNSHIYFNHSNDLDTKRDFSYYANDKVLGTELGGGGFVDYRLNSILNLSAESYFNQNLLVTDPRYFDDQYVQILPKISLTAIPYNVFHSNYPFLKNISIGFDSDYTIFKQNSQNNTVYFRSADRLNFTPYLEWQFGNLGPVFLSHTLKWDYQNYRLPDDKDKYFFKKGFVYETEAKFELERIYGISYSEEKPIALDADEGQKKQSLLIGELPKDDIKNQKLTETVSMRAYRHSEEFKIKHYYLSDQKYGGNNKFYNQIQNDIGQFDSVDALRSKSVASGVATVQDTLPLNNTLEFQWNNNVIRKTSKVFNPYLDGRYLKDNFDYKSVFYFNISQGLDFNLKEVDFNKRLTRFYLNSGFDFDNFTFSMKEFYFHQTGEHKAYFESNYTQSKSSIGWHFTYNSFNSATTPISKLIGGNLEWYMNDLFKLKYSSDYNIQTKIFSQSFYSLTYMPRNNCWRAEVNFSKDLIESKVGFIFYINYNENNFASLNVH